MSDGPIIFRWEGDNFTPSNSRAAKECDERYVIGETYALVDYKGRSAKSHNHYFASLYEAWKNLPEELSERFPSDEHLRKYALIKAGFYDSRTLTCSSKAEALRVMSFVKPADEYGIVTVHEAVVTHYTAKSQSMRAMGKADFQRSKEAVLEIISEMVGVTPKQLTDHASASA